MLNHKSNKLPRLVKIDCKKLRYSAYEGRKLEISLSSDAPVAPEWVEYFRVSPDQVVKEIDTAS